jgi:hypothetical protein
MDKQVTCITKGEKLSIVTGKRSPEATESQA